MTASATFPFHSPPNEPKEVSLQNPNIHIKYDHMTPLVIDLTYHSHINLENEGGIKNAKIIFSS